MITLDENILYDETLNFESQTQEVKDYVMNIISNDTQGVIVYEGCSIRPVLKTITINNINIIIETFYKYPDGSKNAFMIQNEKITVKEIL